MCVCGGGGGGGEGGGGVGVSGCIVSVSLWRSAGDKVLLQF